MLKYINILLLVLFAFTASAQKVNQIKPCKDADGTLIEGCFVVTDENGVQHYTTCSGACVGDDYVLSYSDVKTNAVISKKTLEGLCKSDGDVTVSVTMPDGNTTNYTIVQTFSDGSTKTYVIQNTYSYPSIAATGGTDANGVTYIAGDNLIITPNGIVCIPSKDAPLDIECEALEPCIGPTAEDDYAQYTQPFEEIICYDVIGNDNHVIYEGFTVCGIVGANTTGINTVIQGGEICVEPTAFDTSLLAIQYEICDDTGQRDTATLYVPLDEPCLEESVTIEELVQVDNNTVSFVLSNGVTGTATTTNPNGISLQNGGTSFGFVTGTGQPVSADFNDDYDMTVTLSEAPACELGFNALDLDESNAGGTPPTEYFQNISPNYNYITPIAGIGGFANYNWATTPNSQLIPVGQNNYATMWFGSTTTIYLEAVRVSGNIAFNEFYWKDCGCD